MILTSAARSLSFRNTHSVRRSLNPEPTAPVRRFQLAIAAFAIADDL